MFGGSAWPTIGYDQPIGSALIGSGNWVFLWKGDFALTGVGRLHRRRDGVLPLHGRVHGHRRRRSRPGRWPSAGSGTRSSAGACSAARSTTRSSVRGRGAAAGSPSSGKSAHLGFGYVDFAGSGVVHAMGGVAALAGAIVLGPRIGKYGKDGKPRALGPHHIPMAHARHVHPVVRLVRVQRRVDARRSPTSGSQSWRRTPRSPERSAP